MKHINKKGVKPSQPATPSKSQKTPAKSSYGSPMEPLKQAQRLAPNPIQDGRIAYSIAETSDKLGCCDSTTKKLIKQGLLRARKAHGRVFVAAESVHAFVNGEVE